MSIEIHVGDHDLVRKPAGRHGDRGHVAARGGAVHEDRDAAGGVVRDRKVERPGARQVRDRNARGVGSGRRVRHPLLKRAGGCLVVENDVREARVRGITLIGGRGDQQVRNAVAVDIRDRDGVRDADGLDGIAGALAAALRRTDPCRHAADCHRPDRYWAIFEELRAELGYADYLGALQRYRLENLDDPLLLRVSFFLIDYPFGERLFPGALAALERCARLGTTIILSDGDVVFQPRKVQRAGLWDAVGGRVLIYLHKELMLDAIERRFPADHYVMIDDKLRILAAMKRTWRERLTTVFVRQGHYAHDPRELDQHRAADVTLGRIGELAQAGSPENQASWLAVLTRSSRDV